MSNITKFPVGEKELHTMVNEIGNLVIKKGFSYNQAEQLFNFILERMKAIPYQSDKCGKE